MRVIPPPRPGPRAAPAASCRLPALLPVTAAVILTRQQAPACGPLRRPRRTPSAAKPPGQRADRLQLSRLLRVSPSRPAEAFSSRSSLASRCQRLVRLQRRSQHIRGATPQHPPASGTITCRNRHAAQQTRSPAANHAPRPACRTTARHSPRHTTSEYVTRREATGCMVRRAGPDNRSPAVSRPGPEALRRKAPATLLAWHRKPGRVKQVTTRATGASSGRLPTGYPALAPPCRPPDEGRSWPRWRMTRRDPRAMQCTKRAA